MPLFTSVLCPKPFIYDSGGVSSELLNPILPYAAHFFRTGDLKLMDMAVGASALFLKPVGAAYSSVTSSCTRQAYRASNLNLSLNPGCHQRSKACNFAPILCGRVKQCSSPINHLENEAMRFARKEFYEEVTFRKRDETISLAKAALLVSAEDEAYLSANRERDLLALQKEGRRVVLPPKSFSSDSLLLEGISISTWLGRVDLLSEEVQASLGGSKATEHPLETLKAVQKFTKKSSLTTDSKSFYLHHVLSFGSGTAIMLGIICIEVCRRLGIELKGAPVGEDFILWPLMNNPKVNKGGASLESRSCAEMVFEPCKGGKIWSQNADGSYMRKLPEGLLDSTGTHFGPHSTMDLEPASNRAILSILLRNLKRLYWKRATKAFAGSDIAAPLHPLSLAHAHERLVDSKERSVGALIRPQDLRLAVAASEKLLLLQPHDWLTRRDHGLLLYHSRRYGEAVQELSICMAVAPVQEVQVLEPFVEKLHLLRAESSWTTLLPQH